MLRNQCIDFSVWRQCPGVGGGCGGAATVTRGKRVPVLRWHRTSVGSGATWMDRRVPQEPLHDQRPKRDAREETAFRLPFNNKQTTVSKVLPLPAAVAALPWTDRNLQSDQPCRQPSTRVRAGRGRRRAGFRAGFHPYAPLPQAAVRQQSTGFPQPTPLSDCPSGKADRQTAISQAGRRGWPRSRRGCAGAGNRGAGR